MHGLVDSLTVVAAAVTARIGDSDCERLRDGLLAQPVNALSSFAYAVVGIVIAGASLHARREQGRSVLFAACLVATGLGSVAFHGPQPAGSRFLHDFPILLTVLVMAVTDLALLVRLPMPERTIFVAGGVLAGALTVLSPEAGSALTGALVVVVVVCEVLIHRRHLRPTPRRRQHSTHLIMVSVAAVAGALWVLGRTDSPICDPGDVVQPHGLWHVASAVLFGLWWWLALGQAPKPSSVHAVQPRDR